MADTIGPTAPLAFDRVSIHSVVSYWSMVVTFSKIVPADCVITADVPRDPVPVFDLYFCVSC